MSSFLKTPQLPDGDVQCVAIGACYLNEYGPRLKEFGVEAIGLQGPETLDSRLRGHADLLLLHLGGESFLAVEGLDKHNHFIKFNYVNSMNNDAALNCCLVGKYWIGSPRHAAWQPENLQILAVRQRYTRCSTCIVDDHSIITADHGIALAAVRGGLEVLEISPGHIKLDGFNYGFIGGASFKLGPNKLAFTGHLRQHPDEERILNFLSKRDVKAIYLQDEPICDIGSAVLLLQNS